MEYKAVVEVVLVDAFLHADGERFEIAAGEASVGGEALGEDEKRLRLGTDPLVARGKESAHVHDGVLLRAHRAALGEIAHLPHDLPHALLGVAGLAQLDEGRVLGESAGVEVERLAELSADLGDLVHVGERDRLPAAGVVGDGDHDERDALGAVLGERLAQGVDIHVALERVVRVHVRELGRGQVERERPSELDVGAGRVEVAVVGDDVALFAHDREEDPLGSAALMGRDDVLEPGDVVDRVVEVEVAGEPA